MITTQTSGFCVLVNHRGIFLVNPISKSSRPGDGGVRMPPFGCGSQCPREHCTVKGKIIGHHQAWGVWWRYIDARCGYRHKLSEWMHWPQTRFIGGGSYRSRRQSHNCDLLFVTRPPDQQFQPFPSFSKNCFKPEEESRLFNLFDF